MKVEKDYEELLRLLNKSKVKYCIGWVVCGCFLCSAKIYKGYGHLCRANCGEWKKDIKSPW